MTWKRYAVISSSTADPGCYSFFLAPNFGAGDAGRVGIDSAYRWARGYRHVAEGFIARALEQGVATPGFHARKSRPVVERVHRCAATTKRGYAVVRLSLNLGLRRKPGQIYFRGFSDGLELI